MELIDREKFSIISCKAKSKDFIDGMCFMLDKIDAAPIAFDISILINKIEELKRNHGILIKEGTTKCCYIPVDDVITIINEMN